MADNREQLLAASDGLESPSSSAFGPFPMVADLVQQGEVLRKATSSGNADTYIWQDSQGRRYFVKTFSGHPRWARALIGQSVLKREFKILQQLQAASFVYAPKAIALLEKNTLVMEYLPGQRLESRKYYQADNLPTQDFFCRLQAILQQLHRLGFCHGDFRRANIIIAENEQPQLVDWSTAINSDSGCPWCLWQRWVYRMLRNSDLLSLASIIESFYPGLVNQELQAHLQEPPWYLRLGRFLRHNVYRTIIKPSSRKRYWKRWLDKVFRR